MHPRNISDIPNKVATHVAKVLHLKLRIKYILVALVMHIQECSECAIISRVIYMLKT